MCISPELEERVRKAWFESIPEAYRWSGKYYSPRGDPSRDAIVLPRPSAQLLAKFFDALSPLHLTANQRRAKAARLACGRPGRRKGDDLTSIRQRVRPKQSFLGSPTNASVFCGPFRQTRMRPMGRNPTFKIVERNSACAPAPAELFSGRAARLRRGN
jgi:hypothetical protein